MLHLSVETRKVIRRNGVSRHVSGLRNVILGAEALYFTFVNNSLRTKRYTTYTTDCCVLLYTLLRYISRDREPPSIWVIFI
jgi:hypothetical protein